MSQQHKFFTVEVAPRIYAIKVSVNNIEANAIIDTGATMSAISKNLAEKSSAVKRGVSCVLGVHSTSHVNKYSACLALPNGILFEDIKLVEINSLGTFDVLLGTDILSKGDFAVSKQLGKIYFSYRTPSADNLIKFE